MTTNNGKTKRFSVKRIGKSSGVVHEHITLVDAEDAHYLRNSYWIATIRFDDNKDRVYIVRNRDGEQEFLHALLAGAEPGEKVRHINGDSLDNRKANLLKQSDRVRELE